MGVRQGRGCAARAHPTHSQERGSLRPEHLPGDKDRLRLGRAIGTRWVWLRGAMARQDSAMGRPIPQAPILRDPPSFPHIPWAQTNGIFDFAGCSNCAKNQSINQSNKYIITPQQASGYTNVLHVYILCIPLLPSS